MPFWNSVTQALRGAAVEVASAFGRSLDSLRGFNFRAQTVIQGIGRAGVQQVANIATASIRHINTFLPNMAPGSAPVVQSYPHQTPHGGASGLLATQGDLWTIPVNPHLSIPPGMTGPIRYKLGWYVKPDHSNPAQLAQTGNIGGDSYIYSSVPLSEQELLLEALPQIHAEVGSILNNSPQRIAGFSQPGDWGGGMLLLSFEVDTVQRAW